MSSVPRVTSAVDGLPPSFATGILQEPVMARGLDQVYQAVWGESGINGDRIKEIARMRNARINECGHCRNVRFDRPLEEGLTEDILDDVTDDYRDSSLLSDAEKAVLTLTDALIFTGHLKDQEKQDLRRHFSDAQIAELAFEIAKLGAVAKLLITLGMEPIPGTMGPTVTPTARNGLLAKFLPGANLAGAS